MGFHRADADLSFECDFFVHESESAVGADILLLLTEEVFVLHKVTLPQTTDYLPVSLKA